MKIVTTPPDGSIPWLATDDDTYDGPPARVGSGLTEAEAVADLVMLTETDEEEV